MGEGFYVAREGNHAVNGDGLDGIERHFPKGRFVILNRCCLRVVSAAG